MTKTKTIVRKTTTAKRAKLSQTRKIGKKLAVKTITKR